MSSIQIIPGCFDKKLTLSTAEGIKAGFPSPADDYLHETLDFNRDLIRNPEATFYGKVEGDSMIEAGICNGDIAVIDRSVEPRHGDVVVGYINGEFTIKYLDLRHREDGYIELRPDNHNFKPIRIDQQDTFEVWGVVIWTIKNWRKYRPMNGIIDCDNCYVSCERVFRPDLKDKPVVVLSNNDGCVVARSNEAKRMGITAGMPFYQLTEQYPNQGIAVFSSNYELYGELTGRVVEIIKKAAPSYFRYSIDECFVSFEGIKSFNLKEWGENLYKDIARCVGMPISVGIAPNKTLAKMASHFAKRYEGYHHCCLMDTAEKRIKALQRYPIDKVWGVGQRYSARLKAMGVNTAFDFAMRSHSWVRAVFNNIVIERTWRELNGEDCVPNEELAKKKSICTSRSFNGMITDIEELRTHVSNYAARCADKLRKQDTVATIVGVFLHTNAFREDLPQYWNFQEVPLITPTSSTIAIVKAANDVLRRVYRQGYHYKKAGVIVMGIGPNSPIQPDFFDISAEQIEKMRRLDAAVDRVNKVNGTETIVLGCQQYTRKAGNGKADVFANAMRHEYRSKNPTTRWSDIIILK